MVDDDANDRRLRDDLNTSMSADDDDELGYDDADRFQTSCFLDTMFLEKNGWKTILIYAKCCLPKRIKIGHCLMELLFKK